MAIVLMIAFQSCKKDNPLPPETHKRGEIIQLNSLETYTSDNIQQILDAAGAQLPFVLNYAVEAL